MIPFRGVAMQRLLIVVCMALTPAAADAQRVIPLSTGARVRVVAPAVLTAPFTGRVLSVTPDTMLLTSSNDALRLALASRDVATVAVSEGRPRGRRAVLGGAIGVIAGAVLGAYLLDREAPGTFAGLVGLMAGGAIGAPTGAVIGAISAPEQWGPARPFSAYAR